MSLIAVVKRNLMNFEVKAAYQIGNLDKTKKPQRLLKFFIS